jgi:hypothetical protein
MILEAATAVAWILLTKAPDGNIMSVHPVGSERACRELVCGAKWGKSCSVHDAEEKAEAEQARKAQAREEAERGAAQAKWDREHPKQALACAQRTKTAERGGFTLATPVTGDPSCGPINWITTTGYGYLQQPQPDYVCVDASEPEQ